MRTRLLPLIVIVLAACTPKNTPRYTHEGPKEWTPYVAPVNESVELKSMNDFKMDEVYKQTSDMKRDQKPGVLKPLSQFVLNAKFVQTPTNRTTKLGELITAFNRAFAQQLYSGDRSPEFAKIKDDYVNTVLSGCSRDLRRDCVNLDYMSKFPNYARSMTLLAKDLDPSIEAAIKTSGSVEKCMAVGAPCRDLIERRYYYLSAAAWNKRAHYEEKEFKFAYLKYARMFAMFVQADLSCRPDEDAAFCRERQKKGEMRNPDTSTMSYSYLAQNHSEIFQTIISKYEPENYQDPEFKAFVEAFNPWTYSIRDGDIFKGSASRMFEFGTKCCLYVNNDKYKGKLNEPVTTAILNAQATKDHFVATEGVPFQGLVEAIKKQHLAKIPKDGNPYDGYENELFRKLGILDLSKRVMQDRSFYNEYFFAVDRLFRGHLTPAEVEKLLQSTSPERSRVMLPKMVSDYLRINLAFMVVETNRFMAEIYKKNLASDRVFQETLAQSRALTTKWYQIQEQADLVQRVTGSYINGLNLPESKLGDYRDMDVMIKAMTRNIHYLAVFPNMIVMTYFLTKSNSMVPFTSWWGKEFKKDGAKILKDLFSGEEKETWFIFGSNGVVPERITLLYGLEYLLTSEGLDALVAQETEGKAKDRGVFFDLIFNKYLDDGARDLRTKINDFEQLTANNPAMSAVNDICNYETQPAAGIPPKLTVNFLELDKYTYTGIGTLGISGTLNAYLKSAADSLKMLRTQLDSRRIYMQAMMKVIEGDLKRSGSLRNLDSELGRAQAIIKDLDDMRVHLSEIYTRTHHRYFDCAVTLQEVERRRTNRLYDEERAYLSQVFDSMKPLFSVTDGPALDAKATEINEANYKSFSKIVGRTFLLSKYDLFMRMKTRITADIFSTPSENERRVYGAQNAGYYRARSVDVLYPKTAVENNPMFTEGTSATLTMRGTSETDRQDFIRQGITLMSGQPSAFITWQKLRSEDKGLADYVDTLSDFYLLGPVMGKEGKPISISKEELVDAYIAARASLTLDPIDLINVRDFAVEGRVKKADLLDRVFQKDGQTPEALFYALMRDMSTLAALDLKGAGPLSEALEFARTSNSLQTFVFQPGMQEILGTGGNDDGFCNAKEQCTTVVKAAVVDLYGRYANDRLQLVADLFNYLSDFDKKHDAAQLDPRLTQPFYLENGIAYAWYRKSNNNKLLDLSKYNDFRYLIDDFAQKTNNMYGTREKVKF